MGIGEWLIFVVLVTLIFIAAGKTEPGKKSRPTTQADDDVARLRQMQEWDRVSHGEDKNRGTNNS